MDCSQRSWNRRYAEAPLAAPDPWLVAHAGFLALARSPALDVACGLGQNALWLATAGFRVTGVDASPVAVHRAREWAFQRKLNATFEVVDLEGGACFPSASGSWGVISVFHYLHRELFAKMEEALGPGGLLVYKPHLAHALRPPRSHPRRPEFLLRPGELLSSFPSLQVLSYREWTADGGAFAGLLARRSDHSS